MTTIGKTLIATGALLAAAGANAGVIDFEGLAAGTIVDTEYLGDGISISVINLGGGPDLAVVFDTANYTGGDDDLAGPFAPGPGNGLGQLSPGNILIIQEHGPCDANACAVPDDEGGRPGGYFDIVFGGAVTLESIDFFDVELAESGPGENNRITLFGLSGDILPLDVFTPDTGGDNQWARQMIDVAGVTAMRINMGGSGGIDNIVYSPVPIPATLPLLAAALAGLGFARRRS